MKQLQMTAIARMVGAAAVALAVSPAAFGQSCTTCCQPESHHCPPSFWHWQEGPPKIKFKHACPKPVCNPCTLQHAGYYQTCWHPWPWEPDWSHCALAPTALSVEGVASDAAVPTYSPRAPAALPAAVEAKPASRTTNQGNRMPTPLTPATVQK